ncbi:hypothetical protein PInf_028003 [Phytophthora infestans]|nr:hypothetical protein PInf_028003 [Phytophthora infestans]
MDRSELTRLNDSQYGPVRKMGGIFGQDVLRSLAATTPVEQYERVTAFEIYERGLIAHVRESLEATMAAPQATRPKPVWLKVPAFEGKEGENLHFWVRVAEIAIKAGLISNEPFWEYAQMRKLVVSLAGNPLPEDVKTTVFMDDLKVGSARTQLFRVQATTMEEAIQISPQEEYSHKQAGTSREEEHRHDENDVPREAEHRSNDAVAPAATQPVDTGAYSEPEPMDLSSAESLVRCYGCGGHGHYQRVCPSLVLGKKTARWSQVR